jgi:hypothetical protein
MYDWQQEIPQDSNRRDTRVDGRHAIALATAVAAVALSTGLVTGDISMTAVLIITIVMASTYAALIGAVIYLSCRLEALAATMRAEGTERLIEGYLQGVGDRPTH